MSRNLASIECECGLWRFQTEFFFDPLDPSLLTEDQYLEAIGWTDYPKGPLRRPIGHGYDERLVGDHFRYLAPPVEGSPYRSSSSRREGVYQEEELSARYLSVPPEDRYRFRRLDCVFCRRPYVGWYRQDPVNVLVLDRDWADQPGFRLYDLSYWHSFRDEPGELDKVPIRVWTPEKLAALARRWNEEER